MIKDVKLEQLVTRVDDRGYLIEILRVTNEYFVKIEIFNISAINIIY